MERKRDSERKIYKFKTGAINVNNAIKFYITICNCPIKRYKERIRIYLDCVWSKHTSLTLGVIFSAVSEITKQGIFKNLNIASKIFCFEIWWRILNVQYNLYNIQNKLDYYSRLSTGFFGQYALKQTTNESRHNKRMVASFMLNNICVWTKKNHLWLDETHFWLFQWNLFYRMSLKIIEYF